MLDHDDSGRWVTGWACVRTSGRPDLAILLVRAVLLLVLGIILGAWFF